MTSILSCEILPFDMNHLLLFIRFVLNTEDTKLLYSGTHVLKIRILGLTNSTGRVMSRKSMRCKSIVIDAVGEGDLVRDASGLFF